MKRVERESDGLRPLRRGLVGLLVFAAACGAPGTTSAQDDDAPADPEVRRLMGSSDWVTDFSKHSVPLAILIYHEIVNDRVGGLPVAVTYCPLCNTALVFHRSVEGRTLDFGTTGRLRHSDLVMYDRQTDSWWQQARGEAIVGELTGTRLEVLPANTLSWERARALHPDLVVLSRDTGVARRYGTNPYAGYDRPGNRPMGGFFREEVDPRLPAMERVAAVRLGDGGRRPSVSWRRPVWRMPRRKARSSWSFGRRGPRALWTTARSTRAATSA